jgi:hypothetical protein
MPTKLLLMAISLTLLVLVGCAKNDPVGPQPNPNPINTVRPVTSPTVINTPIRTHTPITIVPTNTPVTIVPTNTPVTIIPTNTPITIVPTSTFTLTKTNTPTNTYTFTPTRTYTPTTIPTAIISWTFEDTTTQGWEFYNIPLNASNTLENRRDYDNFLNGTYVLYAYVYGPDPSTPGKIKVNLPAGWQQKWKTNQADILTADLTTFQQNQLYVYNIAPVVYLENIGITSVGPTINLTPVPGHDYDKWTLTWNLYSISNPNFSINNVLWFGFQVTTTNHNFVIYIDNIKVHMRRVTAP